MNEPNVQPLKKPALLMMPSMRPKRSMAAAAIASVAAGSDTSTRSAIACPPFVL